MTDPMTDLEINGKSQLMVLEAVRKGNPELKIVYAGTRQVYGKPQYLPVDEKHPLQPTDVNGINKISGEMYHLVYHSVYGIRASSLRLTNTYGERQLVRHNRQGFIGWFMRKAVLGEEIEVYGDGSQKRDFNHVDDVVDAFLRAGALPAADGRVFNLGRSRRWASGSPHPGRPRAGACALCPSLPSASGSTSATSTPTSRRRRPSSAGCPGSPCARGSSRRSPSTGATGSTTCERSPRHPLRGLPGPRGRAPARAR
jgi:hypothetical protein